MIAMSIKLVSSVVIIASIPFIDALFIPHDISSLSEINGVSTPMPTDQIDSTTLLDLDCSSRTSIQQSFNSREQKIQYHVMNNKPITRPASSQDTLDTDTLYDTRRSMLLTETPNNYDSIFRSPDARILPNRYIVVFNDNVVPPQIAEHMRWLDEISAAHTQVLLDKYSELPPLITDTKYMVPRMYNTLFRGYAATMLPSVASKLIELPEVPFIVIKIGL